MIDCPLCHKELTSLKENFWHCPCLTLKILDANDSNVSGYKTSGFMYRINKNSNLPSYQLIADNMIISADLTWQTLIIQRLENLEDGIVLKKEQMINLPFIFDISSKLNDPKAFSKLISTMIVFS
jgi:hypothetical protein